MNRRGLVGLGLMLGLLFTVSCGQKAATTGTTNRGGTNAGTGGTGGTGGGTGAGGTAGANDTVKEPVGIPPSVALSRSKAFFDDKVLPLVKAAPCTDCHADPRIKVLMNGGLAPQDFASMNTLLKTGVGANDNKLFNMMRGLVTHPGGAQCSTETAPFCAVLQAWYREVFGEGVLSLGRINDIGAASGTVQGWAGSSTAPTSVFKARFYLDGESGKVAMLGESTANLDAQDNNIDGAHSFTFKIPVTNIDNKSHKLYAYAVDAAGKETAMGGSPYTYTVFKASNSAAAQNAYNGAFPASCSGQCHAFTYATKFGSLVGGFGTADWSKDSNTVVNKFKIGAHGGPGFGANSVTSAIAWWCAEFKVDVAGNTCP